MLLEEVSQPSCYNPDSVWKLISLLSLLGFKYLPSIGNIIVDAMEDRIPEKVHKLIKWDPEIAQNRNWNDTLGRFGGPNRVMDFHEVNEWTSAPHRIISKL